MGGEPRCSSSPSPAVSPARRCGRLAAIVVRILIIGVIVVAGLLVLNSAASLEIDTSMIAPQMAAYLGLGILYAVLMAVGAMTGVHSHAAAAGAALLVGGFLLNAVGNISDDTKWMHLRLAECHRPAEPAAHQWLGLGGPRVDLRHGRCPLAPRLGGVHPSRRHLAGPAQRQPGCVRAAGYFSRSGGRLRTRGRALRAAALPDSARAPREPVPSSAHGVSWRPADLGRDPRPPHA